MMSEKQALHVERLKKLWFLKQDAAKKLKKAKRKFYHLRRMADPVEHEALKASWAKADKKRKRTKEPTLRRIKSE